MCKKQQESIKIANRIIKEGSCINMPRLRCRKCPLFVLCHGSISNSSVAAKIYVGKKDEANNPKHYTTGGIETLDFIKAKVDSFESYLSGNIIRYITRYKHKNGLQDLEKAEFYLKQLIGELKD